jgi:signal transduction histidine kinase
MKKTIAGFIVMVFLLAGFQAATAAGKADVKTQTAPTKSEVVAFVKSAVLYAKKNGKDKALKEFMDKKGQFIKGELYIYAYDFKGTVISHGGQPDLAGKNLIGMKDRNGVMVIQELIKLATKGSGWLEYSWPNPVHNNAVETKLGYVEKVDDTWWLGSGMYEVK